MPNTSLLICDDVRLEIDGKIIIIGMYPGNISIQREGELGRLCFMFYADFPVRAMPKNIRFELNLPKGEPIQGEVIVPTIEFSEHHTKWYVRHVLIAQGTPLFSGRIRATMVADGHSFDIAASWITLIPQAPTSGANSSPLLP